MFWSEDKDDKGKFIVPDDVIDVVYNISCKCIPTEHIYPLSEALQQALPWLASEKNTAVHPITGPEAGNGWERPDDEIMYLSRRQKMMIRIPKERLADAEKLVGQTLQVAGFELEVGKFTTKLLSDMPTVFARHVICEPGMSEEDFMYQALEEIKALDVKVRKMMAGKERSIETPEKPIMTRSLMLAELEPDESVRLQEQGIGEGRMLGCGLFIPQKGIAAVNPD
ncbi:MAG: type I-MYXAN CRISPR-associated protein Cas6/Cmx6 [Thioalkalispiraceae bacterium]